MTQEHEAGGVTLVLNADQTAWLRETLKDETEVLRRVVKQSEGDELMTELSKRFLALCLQVRKELGDPV